MQADAVLLIVAALEPEELERLHGQARELDLDVLVEVHDREELDVALERLDADVIGINNRDLTDFTVDVDRTFELLADVPAGKTVVSESGISSRAQIEDLEEVGVDAVLVGEVLMRSDDPEAAVPRAGRGRGSDHGLMTVHVSAPTPLPNPFVAGLLGGLVVLIAGVIAVAAGWVGDEKTTVVQSPAVSTGGNAGEGQGLTVNEIYKRDGPGVVFISAEVTTAAAVALRASPGAARPVHRLGLRDRRGRPRPDKRARGRGREQDRGRLRRRNRPSTRSCSAATPAPTWRC